MKSKHSSRPSSNQIKIYQSNNKENNIYMKIIHIQIYNIGIIPISFLKFSWSIWLYASDEISTE